MNTNNYNSIIIDCDSYKRDQPEQAMIKMIEQINVYCIDEQIYIKYNNGSLSKK